LESIRIAAFTLIKAQSAIIKFPIQSNKLF